VGVERLDHQHDDHRGEDDRTSQNFTHNNSGCAGRHLPVLRKGDQGRGAKQMSDPNYPNEPWRAALEADERREIARSFRRRVLSDLSSSTHSLSEIDGRLKEMQQLLGQINGIGTFFTLVLFGSVIQIIALFLILATLSVRPKTF
jgi:hypothetical protein